MDGSDTLLLTKTLEKVRTEMSLQVLAYNLEEDDRYSLGAKPLMEAMRESSKA